MKVCQYPCVYYYSDERHCLFDTYPREWKRCPIIRMNTFETLDESSVTYRKKEALGVNGFVFDERSRTTRCVFCLLGIIDWQSEDDVRACHERLSPECKRVRQLRKEKREKRKNRCTIC